MTRERIRPDFSDYVAHFTANRAAYGGTDQNEGAKATGLAGTARDRLGNILTAKSVWATKLPHTDTHGACFTECTWASLLDHAEEYSEYGIGFSKEFLFSKGGGPAVYIRADLYEAQLKHRGFDADLYKFLTPYRPFYAPDPFKKKFSPNKPDIDYTHEREWRVTSDLSFDYGDVQFVVVKAISDIQQLPQNAVNAIGLEKFIPMDIYRTVERLWPTHQMPE